MRQSEVRGARSEDRSARGEERGSRGEARRPREGGKLSYNERRGLEALPERIAALEGEQQRLQAESASPEFYKSPADHIHAVLARLKEVGQELDAVLARWVQLEDRE